MRIAITGLPFSGKSTVFKALVGNKTHPQTSSSGKIQLSIGTLEVHDIRLEKLAKILNSEKVTYPKVSLIDLVNIGEKTPKKIETSHIREFDALALVIGVFSKSDPLQDLKNIESELILADMEVLQNRITKIDKERKARPQKEQDHQLLLLKRCEKALEEEKLIKELEFNREELKMLAGFQLLTLKPMIVIANLSEEQLNKGTDADLKSFSLCAKLEVEIEELSEEERPQFLKELGLVTLSRDSFIQRCLEMQDKILFFTVVGKEARGWPIPQGTTALEAAGSVHSDMERGFIRAEVINYKDFVECGSFIKAKEKGLLRLESKEYPVQDGDIINFKFSV